MTLGHVSKNLLAVDLLCDKDEMWLKTDDVVEELFVEELALLLNLFLNMIIFQSESF